MLRTIAMIAMIILSSPPALADWDGTDQSTGNDIAIEPGSLVRSGKDIEVYDYGTGQYRDVTVEDIDRSGSSVDIEYYDNSTGEYGTFEMEDE
jgi:hypothetical protein